MRKLYSKITIGLFFLFGFVQLKAQDFPTAQEIANEMTIGWNIGNTLEALYINPSNGQMVAGETAWGNPQITQRLIDSVKAVGFNTIRIPVAWDVHTNNGIIDAQWIARVKEVVDYCYQQDLYIMLNIHWDNGWLEENCTPEKQNEINQKQANYWNQIATYFKDYDEHLLFASANEPHVDNATQMAVLLSYHQTFINTVRASGGNNDQRILIVQGPSTDVEKTYDLMNTMPTDPVANRLMLEVHFYPYQFSLMEEEADWGKPFYYWGACNHSTTDQAHNPTWGEEDFVDQVFGNLKTKFVDRGYPIILGEFGAKLRTDPTDPNKYPNINFELHKQSREYFLKYVTHSALEHGMIPVYWCAGLGELFNRNTGAPLEQETVHALMEGAYTSLENVNCGNNDCKGITKGHAYFNECGTCVLGYDASCYEDQPLDCNGDTDGTAYIDECGTCVEGNTNLTACLGSLEAEEVCEIDGVELENVNEGFSGEGYINTTNAAGAYATWVLKSEMDQTVSLGFRYANGGSDSRDGVVTVNNVVQENLKLPTTGEWSNWELALVDLELQQGNNEITITANNEGGLANLDLIVFYNSGVSDAGCLVTGSKDFSTQQFIVYPNPTSDKIKWERETEWVLTNTNGVVLKNGKSQQADLSDFPKGIFLLKIEGQVVKVVKN